MLVSMGGDCRKYVPRSLPIKFTTPWGAIVEGRWVGESIDPKSGRRGWRCRVLRCGNVPLGGGSAFSRGYGRSPGGGVTGSGGLGGPPRGGHLFPDPAAFVAVLPRLQEAADTSRNSFGSALVQAAATFRFLRATCSSSALRLGTTAAAYRLGLAESALSSQVADFNLSSGIISALEAHDPDEAGSVLVTWAATHAAHPAQFSCAA
jgi:hypothetical protein